MALTNANGAPGEGAGRQEIQSGRIIDTATNNQKTDSAQDATIASETAIIAAFRKALARKAVSR
jgi:hypothetical protein